MSDSDTLLTTGFVFDASADTSGVKNVLMVHSGASELQQYANADTFVIVYDHSADRETVLSTLMDRFTHLDRIAFAFHYTETRTLLLNNQEWFTDADLDPSNTLSENAQFVLDLLTRFSVPHLDVLACNTLNDFAWKQYYDRVYAQTGVIIGASDNNTGNLKYGGDWVLESTHTDVQAIYFTEAIANYSSLLAAITISGITYTSSSASTVYISATSGVTGEVVIPSTVVISSVTYTVTAIGTSTDSTGVFQGNQAITSVVIPNTVTLIGQNAFRECINLSGTLIIPSSVTSIEISAFQSCSKVSSIYILGSPNIKIIAFYNTNVSSIYVIGPATLQRESFSQQLGTQPRTIYLNSGVTMVSDPFSAMSNVSGTTVYSNSTTFSLANSPVLSGKTINPAYQDANNIVYLRSSGTNLTASVGFAATGAVNILSTAVISSVTYTVTAIGIASDPSGAGVFKKNTNITSVVIPNTVSLIGQYAFSQCSSLTTVYISGSTNIASNSFLQCSINNLYILGAATLASTSFQSLTGLTRLYLNSNVSMTNDPFSGSNVSNTTVYSNNTTISLANSSTLSGKTVNLAYQDANNIVYLPTSGNILTFFAAFAATGAVNILSTAVISSVTYTVTAIGTSTDAGGSGVFENNTNITSIVIPSTVTLIGKFAFRNCTNLATVSLSNGLDTIQSNAFDNCDSITRMIIPSSVSNIIPYSFFGASNLAEIYIYGSPLIGSNAFMGCKGTTIVVLGPAKLSNYSFNCWNTSTIYLHSGVSITNDPFVGITAANVTVYSNSSALSLANSTVLASKTVNVLSTSLNNIQYRTIGMPTANTAAVNYAPNISGSVIIPENVVFGQTAYTITEIDPMAFAGNDGITSVYFSPSCSISNIGTMSFMGCANLSSVVLPNNITNISSNAFDGCIHLTSASIPSGVLYIGGKAFQNSGLVSVSIPSSVSAFGSNMFYLCSDLTTATLNNNPTVDANTFFRCSKLTSVATLSTSTNVISGVGTNYTSVARVVKDAATNVCYTIPAGTASNGSIFVSASPNATGSVSISATYTINSVSYNVTSIAANAFQGCNGITSISLPNSIRSVGDYAFLGCTGLTTLTSGASGASFITGGATGQRLGVQCFAYCTSLTSVSVPSTYTVIGEYTFLNCSVLTTVSIPSVAGITNTTGGNAFYGTAITSLTNV